jgi:PEGA domain
VTVIPYRPYVYRPSLGFGIYYGAGGSYPYGYTPRGYYDPIPGRPYGGLRITGAPREAHVFADGYYVGIVNDFDGVFQHLNLEAGAHRIEVEVPGYETIAFDVMVQPGRTITLRADAY